MSTDMTSLGAMENKETDLRQLGQMLGVGQNSRTAGPGRTTSDLSLDEMIEVAGVARSFDMMNYLPRVVSTEDLYEMIKSAF